MLEQAKEQVMAAYFVVDIQEISDPQTYTEYSKGVGPILTRYGGKFLARGGAYETIEGDWQSLRLVIVEFDDVDQFKRWYYSPEYTQLLAMRSSASKSRAVVIQGVQ
jgi:uncharacterized protein (DUF1330 family)